MLKELRRVVTLFAKEDTRTWKKTGKYSFENAEKYAYLEVCKASSIGIDDFWINASPFVTYAPFQGVKRRMEKAICESFRRFTPILASRL